MSSFALNVQIFFLLACLVIQSFGYYPSGSAMGRSFVSKGLGYQGGFSGRGQQGMGMGYGYGYGRSRGVSITISMKCDEDTPYQDECQRRCICRNNQMICPGSPCEDTNACPSYGGSYQKDCNTCICLDIGSICTANQC